MRSSETSGGTPPRLRVGSLFAGIGGIDLGLERTGGFETVWFSEIDPFANAVLAKHWPDVPNHGDVRNIGAGVAPVDLVAGGFPCQPVSLAGKRLGQEDPRWLWPHVARVVGDLRPRYVLLENVPGLRSKGLGDVLEDLSSLGYDAEWDGIPAAAIGAPHRRDRVWIVAYRRGAGRREDAGSAHEDEAEHARRSAQNDHVADGDGQGDGAGSVPGAVADALGVGLYGRGPALEGPRIFAGQLAGKGGSSWVEWLPEPAVGRVVDGVPGRVAQLRALGNAVVPQVAEVVGRLILADYYRTEAQTARS